MTQSVRIVRIFCAIGLVSAFFGCGKTSSVPASISGKVSYNGAPLKGGNVMLFAKEGGVYTLAISEDGTYSGSSLPAGEMQVAIDTETIKTAAGPKQAYGQGRGAPAGGAGASSPMPGSYKDAKKGEAPAAPKVDIANYVKIPDRYRDKDKSDLKITLAAGSNPGKDFDLK